MSRIHEILRTHWGYEAFRPLQEEIIRSVLDGKDTLALLPTGGGKSICYQVPAMAGEGICLVISPLIALMKDQVEGLQQRGILAAAIYSGQSHRQIVQTLKNVAHGPYKLLYVSPERLETALFREFLPALDVRLIAVDEAHCVSQWGHDFRPSYLRIAALRTELPGVPVLALTASATAAVQEDICTQLALKGPQLFRQPYARPNLSYSVFRVESKAARLVEILEKVEGTAIVYASSRRRTVELAGLLQGHRISADHYHAGLSGEVRAKRQEDWIGNRTRVMVCTNAFGMGIDKPDVRLVVHADPPDSLESYYQEAGRAGRDGKKSYAVLLYTDRDIETLQQLPEQRYPDLETVRNVYNAVVHYLQIPTYTGEDRSYPFSFTECTRRFGLPTATAMASLKAMEGDGWIDFQEKSFRPATVRICANRQALQEYCELYPDQEPLLSTLLRTYGGIWDYPVFTSEKVLAGLLRKSVAAVQEGLLGAQASGILVYSPVDESPRLTFRRHRVNVADFRMDMAAYSARREAFRERVDMMIRYLQTDGCRSLFINRYFGDDSPHTCGRCDGCLARRGRPLTPAEAEAIGSEIRALVRTGPHTPAELFTRLPGVPQEKAWKVIEYLQSEGELGMDERGRLFL